MTLRGSMEQLGGLTGMVDKMIGNAFPIVRTVADNIDAVNYCKDNMEAIVLVAEQLESEITYNLTTVAGTIGAEASIPYPSGVTNAKVRGMTVILVAGDGTVYLPGESYTAMVVGGALKVTLLSGAPSPMVGGLIRWRLTATP